MQDDGCGDYKQRRPSAHDTSWARCASWAVQRADVAAISNTTSFLTPRTPDVTRITPLSDQILPQVPPSDKIIAFRCFHREWRPGTAFTKTLTVIVLPRRIYSENNWPALEPSQYPLVVPRPHWKPSYLTAGSLSVCIRIWCIGPVFVHKVKGLSLFQCDTHLQKWKQLNS